MAGAGEGDGEGRWVVSVTARAPTNIAVIKYWGKRDEARVLPLNSSLSATLDPNDLCATTTVAASPAFDQDRLWLNGKEMALSSHRYQTCLAAVRERAQAVTRQWAPLFPRTEGEGEGAVGEWAVGEGGGERGVSADEWKGLKLHIVSSNSFPTAAGLASSAAGFACLVYATCQLMGVQEAYPGELTAFARMGSGSACRSLYGGFVRWNKGEREDGSDSIAEQVAPRDHWEDIVIIVAVVNDASKEVSSTGGMATSVQTSELLKYRAQVVVPKRMKLMEEAIAGRKFPEFVSVTCADSNQFHATCLDTAPPIFYLNQTSKRIIDLVEKWNREDGGAHQAAYTFDAGPNAVLFVEKHNAAALFRLLLSAFPPSTPPSQTPDAAQQAAASFVVGKSATADDLRSMVKTHCTDATGVGAGGAAAGGDVKYFICTAIGDGCTVLSWQPPAGTI